MERQDHGAGETPEQAVDQTGPEPDRHAGSPVGEAPRTAREPAGGPANQPAADETAPPTAGDEPPGEGDEPPTAGDEPPGKRDEDTAGRVRVTELEAALAVLQGQLDERVSQLQRLQADFSNYRRRMMEEQGRWERRAAGNLLRELLPVMDNLERAAAAEAGAETLREGLTLTLRQFQQVLAANGVERIEARGRVFDPTRHEAVMQVESDQVPDNHVLEEIQAGYLHGTEVLRPSLVQVARNPADAGDKAPADEPAARDGEPAAAAAEEGEDHGEGRGH